MKTEAEIRHEYEATKAKMEELRQKLYTAIDDLGRFPYNSRDDKIAWKTYQELQDKTGFYAIRLGTLRFVLNMPPDEARSIIER